VLGGQRWSRGAAAPLLPAPMEQTLEILNKNKKIVYVVGDTNINLLQCDRNNMTKKYMDMIYSQGWKSIVKK